MKQWHMELLQKNLCKWKQNKYKSQKVIGNDSKNRCAAEIMQMDVKAK